MNNNDEIIEIDLLHVLEIIKKNLIMFISICIVTCTIGFAISKFVLDETFTAVAKIIIVKDEKASSSSSTSITYSDIQLSQKLASTYQQILMSEAISDTVIDNLNLREYGIDSGKYGKIVTVKAADSTEVMNISVETTDPKLSANIANEIVKVFISKIYDIMEIQNVTILNNAKVPSRKSGPSTFKWTAIGGLIGACICALIAFIEAITDTKIKSEKEVKEIFTDCPIIGSIPDFLPKEIKYDDNED